MSYTQAEVAALLKEVGGSYGDLIKTIKDMGTEFDDFKSRYDNRIDAIETGIARGEFQGGGSSRGTGVSSSAAREHGEKFLAWARKGTDPEGLRGLEVKAELSTESDPDGGFMIPKQIDREMDKLAVDTVAMRRIALVRGGLYGDYKRLLSAGGATGGWVGERDERTDTDTPELKQFSPPWSEWYALPEVTQALLDDAAFDVQSWLLDELLDVETTMEGTAFISGTGKKQPRGILTYDTIANANWVWGKVGYIAGGHASLLNNADKLKALKRSLKPTYRQNGIWLMNDTTAEVIGNFKDGNGNYIWKEGLTEGAPDTLLGSPVEYDDNMPDIGADSYPIAYANWQRAYMIGDHRAGRRLLRDPYTKKGWVKFYVSKRVFGGIINHQAIKLLKIATA